MPEIFHFERDLDFASLFDVIGLWVDTSSYPPLTYWILAVNYIIVTELNVEGQSDHMPTVLITNKQNFLICGCN